MVPLRLLALFIVLLLLLQTPSVVAKRKVKKKKKTKDAASTEYQTPEVEEIKYSSEEEKVGDLLFSSSVDLH